MTMILLSCTNAKSEVSYKFLKPTQSNDVAKYNDIVITRAEMEKGLKSDIYKLEKQIYDLKFGKVKALLIEKLIKADPQSKGMTNDAYLEKFIASKITISDKAVEEFIKEKNIPEKHVNPEIKVKIKDHLRATKNQEAIEGWLAEKTKSTPIEVYLNKPIAPKFKVNTAGSASSGPNDAKVTVVEFSDFQCPFCAKGADIVNALKKKYKGKVKFVFKNFPLPFHKQAEKAAVAAECVNEQGSDKFWKMHDAMFADQSKLAEADLIATAKKIGADEKKFTECLKTNKYLTKVKKDFAEGKELGIDSTPTFYVNGKIVNGAQPIEVFSELIEEEL
jgi:protein-disulfide isomerase